MVLGIACILLCVCVRACVCVHVCVCERELFLFHRANAYAERLRLGLAVIHGEDKDVDPGEDEDGRNSPPPPPSVPDKRPPILPGSKVLRYRERVG